MKFGFYGCGNMGRAILKSIIKQRVMNPSDIVVYTKSSESSLILQHRFEVQTTNSAEELRQCQYILLGFKPQVLPEIKPLVEEKIVLSILAGTNIKTLQKTFPNSKIVRAMPNLPIQTGNGMTALFFDPQFSFTEEEKRTIRSLFQAGGEIVELETEQKMHEFTALCGSSPAYLLYLLEKMETEAQKMGFTPKESENMMRQILIGTAKLVKREKTSHPFQKIRERISSHKGVTQQAIETFEAEENQLISKILQSAIKRSQELEQL
jgi:pyrroline-5-carboxylate reductase